MPDTKVSDLPEGTPGRSYILKIQEEYGNTFEQFGQIKGSDIILMLLSDKVEKLEEKIRSLEK